MRRIRRFEQPALIDRWYWVDASRRRELDRSWPGALQQMLHVVPAELHASLFHPSLGRPAKESVMVVGLMVLQQMFDLTDRETVDRLCFDLRFQFGLDVLPQDATIGLRTLERARASLVDRADEIFVTATDRLIAAFDVDTRMQRTDSTLVQSNIRKLARVQLFVRCIRGVLMAASRAGREVPAELLERYTGRKGEWFGDTKPSAVAAKLAQAAADAWHVLSLFRGDGQMQAHRSYKLLRRMFEEQCCLRVEEDRLEVAVKEKLAPEDRGTSLVNPADPEAGYDGHRKQIGYQLQVTETCGQNPGGPNLITRIDVEPVNTADLDAVPKVHEELEARGIKPTDHLCDAGYASDALIEQAAEEGVRLTTPVRGRTPAEGKLSLADFELSEDGKKVLRCPQGQLPCRLNIRGDIQRSTAIFDRAGCATCPYLDVCPIKLGPKGARLRFTWKAGRTARRRYACQYDEQTKKRYALRSGIEATISHLKHDRGLKRLRFRGAGRVRLAVCLGALADNLWRVACHIGRQGDAGGTPTDSVPSPPTRPLIDLAARLLRLVRFSAPSLRPAGEEGVAGESVLCPVPAAA